MLLKVVDNSANRSLRELNSAFSLAPKPIPLFLIVINSVAMYYEEEFDGAVDNMSSLIEPIMIVFMGIMIGGLMIAMYSPIFNVGALIG